MQVQAAWLSECFEDVSAEAQTKDAPWGASRGLKDRSLNLEHFPPLTVQPGVRVVLRRAMKAVLLPGRTVNSVRVEIDIGLIGVVHLITVFIRIRVLALARELRTVGDRHNRNRRRGTIARF